MPGKRFFHTLILLVSVARLSAQPALKGVVADRDSLLANASLRLFRLPDTVLAAGAVSQSKGLFSFYGIGAGRYVLKASCMGYKTYVSGPVEVPAGYLEKWLDTVYLEPEAASLEAVRVTGRANLLTIQQDRTVLNVESNVSAAGDMALDLIARMPGVSVNYQDGSISMNGKKGVVIMINGKPNYLPPGEVVKLLQGLGSGNIKKIEFISTPPSNLDAQGDAGFINILLKKAETDGLSGSVAVMNGYGKGFLTSESGNFNYWSNKINFYGDGSYALVHNRPFTEFYRRVSNQGNVKENYSVTDRNATIPNITGRLGLDIVPDPRTTMGVILSTYDNKFRLHAVNTASISSMGHLDTVISIANREVNHWKNYSANFNLQHTLGDKSLLTFNADYVYYKNSDPVDYTNTYFNGAGTRLYEEKIVTTKKTPINFKVVSVDFSKRLDSVTVLDMGVKATLSRFSNDIDFYRLQQGALQRDSALSSLHTLREDYPAAYVSLSARPRKRLQVRLGMRYEYTRSNLSTETGKKIIDRHYGNLFPNVLLSYNLANALVWGASYSRRITRPTFNDLAPFTYYQDPNTFLSGNPALQPSLSNTIKTDIQYKKYFFSLSYILEKGSIQMYQITIDSVTGKQFFLSENIKSLKTFDASLNASFQPFRWLSCLYTIEFVRRQAELSYLGSPVARARSIWNFNGVQRASLGKNFWFELSGFFKTGDIVGILVQRPYGSLDAGIKKGLGKGGALTLSLSNAFNSLKFHFLAEDAQRNLYSTIDADLLYRAVKLTYVRPFGNQKVREKRTRNTGSEEEKSRIN